MGLKTTAPLPHVPSPPPPPEPSPPPFFLKLNVAALRPEAWWRSCLWVSVNGRDSEKVLVGCNKGEHPLFKGKSIAIPVDLKVCNSLRFHVDVYHPVSKETCRTDGECQTKPEPECKRTSVRAVDKDFFVAVDALKLGEPGALPKKVDATKEEVRQAIDALLPEAQKNPTGKKLILVFFEDQTNANLKAFEDAAGTATGAALETLRKTTGIDFNDLAFYIEAENVAVTVEGSGVPCAIPETTVLPMPQETNLSPGCAGLPGDSKATTTAPNSGTAPNKGTRK